MERATLFHNGTVLTPTGAATALLMQQGRILACGPFEQLRQRTVENTALFDLQGKTLAPGFIDAHIHLWKVGDLLTFMLDLRGVASIEAMQDQLADFARRNPHNPWILARGFNEALFEDGRMPNRFDIDKAVDNRPVQVIRTCAHIAVLNSKAMERCGIGAHTIVPAGGEIRRGADGVPNGILSETALGLVRPHLPVYSPEAYRAMILAAQAELLRHGITSATDPAVHPELLEVYRQMDRAGELNIRIHAIPIRVPDGDAEALPLPAWFQSEHLRVDTVKFFADGGLSGKTAALQQPYRNTDEHGVLRLSFDFFKQCAEAAQAAGFRLATHAIGDRAIDLTMAVYGALASQNKAGLRHRIEHLGLPSMEHLQQMRDLGLHCVTQPIFLYELGQNFRQYLPDFYLNRVYPYRAVLDAGVNLAFSSDAPVVKNFNPLMGLRNAVERCDRSGVAIGSSQLIRVGEAWQAYTLGAAAANGDALDRGSLEPGKRADMVLLDQNPLAVPMANISDIRVEQTWVAGQPML